MGLKFFRIDAKNTDESKIAMLRGMGCFDEAIEGLHNERMFGNNVKHTAEKTDLDDESYDPFDLDNVDVSRFPGDDDAGDQSWHIWAFCDLYNVDLVIHNPHITLTFQSNLAGENVGVEDGIQPKDFHTCPNQLCWLPEQGSHYEPLVPRETANDPLTLDKESSKGDSANSTKRKTADSTKRDLNKELDEIPLKKKAGAPLKKNQKPLQRRRGIKA